MSRDLQSEGLTAIVCAIVLASLSVGLLVGIGVMRALGAR